MTILINIVGLQLGWFACIWGAASGRPGLGPVVVFLHLCVHLATSARRTTDLGLIAIAALLGLTIDSGLAFLGAFSFIGVPSGAWLSPIWMVALWMNFATGFTRSLGFLEGRLFLAAAVGLLGGPLAYAGGASLGAISLLADWALPAIGVAYAFVMPLLLRVGRPRASLPNSLTLSKAAS